MRISSIKNPHIKNLVALQKSSTRKKTGLFVIEGLKEVQLAVAGGYLMETVFYCPEILGDIHLPKIQYSIDHIPVIVGVERNVFEKIAYREDSGGIMAIARQRSLTLGSLKLSEKPLVVVLEKVEKPGNMGAILRSADAAAIDAVIICDPQTDIYNPNVVRSSIGCLFTIQVAISNSSETLHWLNTRNIRVYATTLEASEFYHKADYRVPCAIVMGTESTGLTGFWTSHADARIKIPMLGRIDSLNVSTAAAIIIFEAKKQRDFAY